MMKVVYISHESESVLGSTKSLYNMIHSLRKEVIPVVVVPKLGPAYDFFKSKGIRCIAIPFSLAITDKSGIKKTIAFLPRLLRDWVINTRAIAKAEKLLCDEDICLIHSNSSTVDWGYQLARKMKLPHVWHLREFQDLDFNFMPFRGWKYLLRKIHASDVTISITDAIQNHFKLVGVDKAFRFFNAVRKKDDIAYCSSKEPYFLLCGMLSRAKGLELAINSFALFSKNTKGYRLIFVGIIQPLYKEELESLASKIGVKEYIEFHGYTSNVDSYFQKATAFLMCSQNEAMGRVTVEAMFNGCPVIAFNGGGSKEIIKHKDNGLLFNNAEECASAMSLISKNINNHKMIARGHEDAQNYFSEEAYREKILDAYSSVINISALK